MHTLDIPPCANGPKSLAVGRTWGILFNAVSVCSCLLCLNCRPVLQSLAFGWYVPCCSKMGLLSMDVPLHTCMCRYQLLPHQVQHRSNRLKLGIPPNCDRKGRGKTSYSLFWIPTLLCSNPVAKLTHPSTQCDCPGVAEIIRKEIPCEPTSWMVRFGLIQSTHSLPIEPASKRARP